MKKLFGFKAAVLLLALAMLLAAYSPFAFASGSNGVAPNCVPGHNVLVTMRILGYDNGSGGAILNDSPVSLNDTSGYTVLDALEKACASRQISYTVTQTKYGPYVSEIGGETEKYFQPDQLYFSGWSFRVWPATDQPANPEGDILPSVGADTYTLHSGDKVTWYYDLPAESWYTTMDNYSTVGAVYRSGEIINVSVKGQKYEDTVNWNLLPFTSLAGATVTLTRVRDGVVLASAVSDSSGNAALRVPRVDRPTECFIGVKSSFFTEAPVTGGLENVASWRKPVTILR